MFARRSQKLERMDTGDYTPEEYERFLKDIAFINRRIGDAAAIEKTLLAEIERLDLKEFSVLDLGAGSGELLRFISEFAHRTNRRAFLVGLDLHEQSLYVMKRESAEIEEIHPLLADALHLPFDDDSFDFTISSLFTHHLSDDLIVQVFREMDRVSASGIFSIDLHRHPIAWILYKLFCWTNGISPMVRYDGSLSILRSFKKGELLELAKAANLKNNFVREISPYRLVVQASVATITDRR